MNPREGRLTVCSAVPVSPPVARCGLTGTARRRTPCGIPSPQSARAAVAAARPGPCERAGRDRRQRRRRGSRQDGRGTARETCRLGRGDDMRRPVLARNPHSFGRPATFSEPAGGSSHGLLCRAGESTRCKVWTHRYHTQAHPVRHPIPPTGASSRGGSRPSPCERAGRNRRQRSRQGSRQAARGAARETCRLGGGDHMSPELLTCPGRAVQDRGQLVTRTG